MNKRNLLVQVTALATAAVVSIIYMFVHLSRQVTTLPAGQYNAQMHYFSSNSIVSYAHTDPNYGIQLITHPLSLLPEHNWYVSTLILLFVGAYALTYLIYKLRGSLIIANTSTLLFFTVGYMQTSAQFFYTHTIAITYLILLLLLSTQYKRVAAILAIGLVLFELPFLIIFAATYAAINKDAIIYALTICFIGITAKLVFIQNMFSYPKMPNYTLSLVEFGQSDGFFGTLLVFGIISSFFVWDKKYKKFYAVGLLFILVMLVNPLFGIGLTFLCAFATSVLLRKLTYEKWVLSLLPTITIVALLCTVYLSFSMFYTQVQQTGPTQEEFKVVQYIERYANEGIIVAEPIFGAYIEAYGQGTLIAPSYIAHNGGIFRIEQLNELQQELQTHSAKYIVVNNQVRLHHVPTPNSGIVRLTSDRETFRKIYNTTNIDVFEVIQHD